MNDQDWSQPSAAEFPHSLEVDFRALKDSLDCAFGLVPWSEADSSAKERIVRQILKSRSTRARHFPPELFGDPAWDMLLDLFAMRLAQRRVSVTSLVLASGVPTTTGLRWLKVLIDEGFATRMPDPTDGRRVYVSMTDKAFEAMDSYFRTLPPGIGSV